MKKTSFIKAKNAIKSLVSFMIKLENKFAVITSKVEYLAGVGTNFIGAIISYLKTFYKTLIKSIMRITLDKLLALLFGAIFLASLKYAISGCLSVS
jgi:hypothetical protein